MPSSNMLLNFAFIEVLRYNQSKYHMQYAHTHLKSPVKKTISLQTVPRNKHIQYLNRYAKDKTPKMHLLFFLNITLIKYKLILIYTYGVFRLKLNHFQPYEMIRINTVTFFHLNTKLFNR